VGDEADRDRYSCHPDWFYGAGPIGWIGRGHDSCIRFGSVRHAGDDPQNFSRIPCIVANSTQNLEDISNDSQSSSKSKLSHAFLKNR
jgi:hypothetical protein